VLGVGIRSDTDLPAVSDVVTATVNCPPNLEELVLAFSGEFFAGDCAGATEQHPSEQFCTINGVPAA
jgi:hypothetical protein